MRSRFIGCRYYVHVDIRALSPMYKLKKSATPKLSIHTTEFALSFQSIKMDGFDF